MSRYLPRLLARSWSAFIGWRLLAPCWGHAGVRAARVRSMCHHQSMGDPEDEPGLPAIRPAAPDEESLAGSRAAPSPGQW
jgi:hypothetical protein